MTCLDWKSARIFQVTFSIEHGCRITSSLSQPIENNSNLDSENALEFSKKPIKFEKYTKKQVIIGLGLTNAEAPIFRAYSGF